MRNTQESTNGAIDVIGKILVGFFLLLYLAYWVYLIFTPELSHIDLSVKLASMAIVVITVYIFFRVLSERVQKIKRLIGHNSHLKERDIEIVEAGYAAGISFLVYGILLLLVAQLFGGVIIPYISRRAYLNKNPLPTLIPRTEIYWLSIVLMIIGAICLLFYPLTARSKYRQRDG